MKRYRLQEWKKVYGPLIKIFSSRTRRWMFIAFLLFVILSLFMEGESELRKSLQSFLGSLGAGGAFIFLGINILRFLPHREDDLNLRWGWIWMASLFSLGGILTLLNALWHLASIFKVMI